MYNKEKKRDRQEEKNNNHHSRNLNYYRVDDGTTCVTNPVVLVTIKF
jgi:hypothetical protein